MSLFSHLFRKAPPPPAPSDNAGSALPKPSAADRALAAAAEESALRSALDAKDVQAVARLVVAGTSSHIRRAAAEAIEDPDVLRQLIREVRGGKDKSVYKVLTAKRDVLLEQARKHEQLQAEIHAVSEALERLSQRPYDTLSSSKLEHWESRWNAVASQVDPELRGRVEQWIARAREPITEHLRQVADQASREQAAAEAAAEAQRLREAHAQAAAAAAAEQARVLEQQAQALAEARQAEQKAVREIGEWIRKTRAALGEGNTKSAARMRRTLEEKLAAAPPLPANVASQIQQLDKQLEDLKDWKSFSVAPKRAELIEAMEWLIGVKMDAPALADRIKSLQEEWRSLSKGAGENAEADWQRFHEAAQKAYQPCSEYFAAQARVREQNLQRRDAVLAKLTAFEAGHNWEQPDWRAVINTLRETKQQWRSHSAVDRKAGKQQEKNFETLTASLQGRLEAEYARNVAQKESLIERAQQLLASDDARKAIDAIKRLQQQWQIVGPVPREVDQRLWSTFRQHCDAVFQKRQQDLAAYTTGLENNKTQAIALCGQIEKIADLEGPELLASAGALAELRKTFDALGEFPRAESRELRTRRDQALDRCERAFARQRARDAEGAWNDLFEAANLVRAYRLAVVRRLDAEQLGILKAAAETYMASIARWPKRGLEALKEGLAREPSADLAANEVALRMLCIRAEILADLPTPPEDSALRRDYLLQRLVQGMGQGLKAEETSDSLVIEWASAGPVEDATYQPLLQRFRRCRDRGNARAT